MIAAQKSGNKVRLSVLRMLRASLKNREIEKRTLPNQPLLTEEDVLKVISQLVKQRRESIEMFEKGGRLELASNEKAEAGILEEYLPKQLNEEEINKIIDETLRELSSSGPVDIGRVMKALMPRVAGRADGKVVNQLVRAKLSGSTS
ncbi:MAG: GatB/YqeY domain-containing protein [Deltaproteobacteria bacterium]|nr:GatB/YqeY domain-containing protein [Deltaproteobacteria bacterium]